MMKLSDAAHVLGARHTGADRVFTAVNTDTRKLQPGDLFVALKGERYDGHAFLLEAARRGAAGALVSAAASGLSAVEVADTRLALGRLAAHWRGRFAIPVVGVTGSNGKTTVKNMIASILAETGPGLATQGNLNNDIGVPLTLLRLREQDRYAVVEMGMNHLGEIDYLTRLARPTVALITNAGEAHLEGVGSIENVARAKGEIFAGLDADGTAVINADDVFADFWRRLAADRRQLSFALTAPADVTGDFAVADFGTLLHLTTPEGEITMRLSLLGKHNVMNALAASAASLAAGASLSHVKDGLEKLRAAAGRLEIKTGVRGARLLDDTYNANPASVAAGLDVLRESQGERVLVLGDMAELGETAPAIHRRIGELAKQVGVDRLLTLGALARLASEAFGRGAEHYDSHEALIAALRECMHPEMTVLVKGSRVMQMERIVNGVAIGETA